MNVRDHMGGEVPLVFRPRVLYDIGHKLGDAILVNAFPDKNHDIACGAGLMVDVLTLDTQPPQRLPVRISPVASGDALHEHPPLVRLGDRENLHRKSLHVFPPSERTIDAEIVPRRSFAVYTVVVFALRCVRDHA